MQSNTFTSPKYPIKNSNQDYTPRRRAREVKRYAYPDNNDSVHLPLTRQLFELRKRMVSRIVAKTFKGWSLKNPLPLEFTMETVLKLGLHSEDKHRISVYYDTSENNEGSLYDLNLDDLIQIEAALTPPKTALTPPKD